MRQKQRGGQALVETALLLPMFFVLALGVIEIARAAYVFSTIQEAAAAGARAAVAETNPLPTNAIVEAAVKNHAQDVQLNNPCPNGYANPPPDSAWDPATPNTGYLFITMPPSEMAQHVPNMPGGQAGYVPGAACNQFQSAANNNSELTITINYNFQPFTPLVSSLTGSIMMRAQVTARTEY